MKGLTWRIWVVAGTILFGFYLLFPTIYRFRTGKVIPKIAKADDPWWYSLFPSETLKLGLDLKGGLHLSLGIDFNEVNRDSIVKLKNQLIDLAKRNNIEGLTFETTTDNKVRVNFSSDKPFWDLDKAISRELGQYVDPDKKEADHALLKMTPFHEAEVRRQAIEQSLETLRNRIDEFGVAEPIITRQGEDKIMVQFPGLQDPGRLKEIIARTAKLSFQIERSGPEEPNGPPSDVDLRRIVDEYVRTKGLKLDATNPITKHTREMNTAIAAKLPKGTEILFHKKVDVNTKEAEYIPYLLDREPLVTGEDLQDAYMGFNQQTNEPIVNFSLTPNGASKFEQATGANVGKYMAIVLDSNVHSAPRIKQRIGGGHALIEMGSQGRNQQDVHNDAKDTALVLRSGALPARIEFLEERIVGPSLGEDAIKAGSMAMLFGAGAVFLFLLLYYRTSGTFAVFALLMNFLFILAGMAAFEGTLTLPGLAGMILGLGMSVDSNVLIFEHMRDELRTGKAIRAALAEGYAKSNSAIWDANLTAIISGVVLLGFGYGPIKGFAVTLLLGLVSSVYTAVFVTRVFFDYFVVARNANRIAI